MYMNCNCVLLCRDFVAISLREQRFFTQAYISTTSQNFSTNGKISDRVFANYNIYKGKVALSASPRLPQFRKLDSGGLKVDRQGTIMLSFSPAIGERKYDWEKKQHADQVRKTLQVKPHADGSGYFISLGVVNNTENQRAVHNSCYKSGVCSDVYSFQFCFTTHIGLGSLH